MHLDIYFIIAVAYSRCYDRVMTVEAKALMHNPKAIQNNRRGVIPFTLKHTSARKEGGKGRISQHPHPLCDGILFRIRRNPKQ